MRIILLAIFLFGLFNSIFFFVGRLLRPSTPEVAMKLKCSLCILRGVLGGVNGSVIPYLKCSFRPHIADTRSLYT